METKRQIKKASNLKVDFEKVMYLSSDINYTALHFENGQTEIFAYTLKLFEEHLGKNGHFIRIHRHFMVNRQFIEMKNRKGIRLLTGMYLPIARRRKLEIAI